MKTLDYSHFIERYLANEMDESERRWFQSEIDGNLALQREVNLRRQTDVALRDSDILSLRKKLAIADEGHRRKVRASNRQKQILLQSAAIFAGIILIGSLILLPGRKSDMETLYNRYYTAYEAPSNTRSMTIDTDALFQNAIGAYQACDYQAAITFLEKVLIREENKIESRFLLGMSQMEIAKFKQAGQSFTKVIEHNDNLFLEEANWYLGLCYMMTNEKDKADEQFRMVAASNSIYKKKARKILRQLQ